LTVDPGKERIIPLHASKMLLKKSVKQNTEDNTTTSGIIDIIQTTIGSANHKYAVEYE